MCVLLLLLLLLSTVPQSAQHVAMITRSQFTRAHQGTVFVSGCQQQPSTSFPTTTVLRPATMKTLQLTFLKCKSNYSHIK